ncbi:MAG TPA: hypothetical protein VF618_15610 [Thermoanaerobaculia bacterium]
MARRHAGADRGDGDAQAAGKRWTDDEDARLCRAFDDGVPVGELAARHGRTNAAITLRLVKLGRIDPSEVQWRDRGARVAS